MKQIAILKKVISSQMEHPDFSGDTIPQLTDTKSDKKNSFFVWL